MAYRTLTTAILVISVGLSQMTQAQLQVNPNTGETQKQFAQRTNWWRQAKFGMFIHWGVYAIPADGEWHMNSHKMQVADYEKYAPQFNPVKFDAKAWVKVAKDAGMKYITITSKHHDGFCMFDSKLTDYTITKATPFKRDPLKELAAECKKQGITLCFYHSVLDWHHPDYLPRREWEKETRPADGADFNRYIDYMKGQLTELLTNYGPIGGIWFDGGWEHSATEYRSLEVVQMMRKLQPGLMVNDRIALPEDYSTPEQNIPANALQGGRLWETCMTLNNNWGFAKNDHDWKSPLDVIQKLCDITSKGGNFLLNVGPDDQGVIPQPSIDCLATVGKWMRKNGKAVYGTTKNPFGRLPFDGRCTMKGKTAFFSVFSWPAGGKIHLPETTVKYESARSLATDEELAIVNGEITKPRHIDPYATVIEVKLSGTPPANPPIKPIYPDRKGNFVLAARDVEVKGSSARVETIDGIESIGYWIDAKDTVHWKVMVPSEGEYSVVIDYSCTPDDAGSTVVLGKDLSFTVDSTSGWNRFVKKTIGTIKLVKGAQTVSIVVENMRHNAVMNLRGINLIRK
jgi:alpha-L-fucosidase